MLRAQLWSLAQSKYISEGTQFFFPSRASVALARSSHIVVLIERITHTLALYPSLGVQKWSTGQATSTLVNRNKTKQNKAKQNHPKKHTNQTKPKQTKQTKQQTKQTKPQKPAKKIDKSAPRNRRSRCAGELTDLAHERTRNNRSQSKMKQRCPAKHVPAAPKPRIPPARIPEIALSSPPGIKHLHYEKLPCNELLLLKNHIGRHPTVWGFRPKLRRETWTK